MTIAENMQKANILLLGGGGVGAISSFNIELGGLGRVTTVLRSNFKVVHDEGYTIRSCDHGTLQGWRPSRGEFAPRPSEARMKKANNQISSGQLCSRCHEGIFAAI